jgi:hypothetical protein
MVVSILRRKVNFIKNSTLWKRLAIALFVSPAPSKMASMAHALQGLVHGQELAGRASAGTLASLQTRMKLFTCDRGILDKKHEESLQCRL